MAMLFPNIVDEIIFLLLFLSLYYLEIVNQAFIAIKNRKFKIKLKGDKLSLLAVYFAGIFAFYCAIAVGLLRVNSGIAACLPIRSTSESDWS